VSEPRWRIEPATAALVPRLRALAAAGFSDPWSEGAFLEELRAPDASLTVARAPDGEVVGYLALRCAADEVHVLSLAVDPARRRQGAGRALLLSGLARAAAGGARLAHLEVRPGNAGALAFYERFGFQAVGRRRRYYPDGEDALLLCARVPGGVRAAGDAA